MSRKYSLWSPEDDGALAKHAGKKHPAEIATIIGRTEKAVKSRANVLGISVATLRLKHKGNNPVKQTEIKQVVAAFKELGSAKAVSEALDIPVSRSQYVLTLARRYGMLPKAQAAPKDLSLIQKQVLDWVRKNPNRKTVDCIKFFRRTGVSYYTAEGAHIKLRRMGLIAKNGDLWSSVK